VKSEWGESASEWGESASEWGKSKSIRVFPKNSISLSPILHEMEKEEREALKKEILSILEEIWEEEGEESDLEDSGSLFKKKHVPLEEDVRR